MANTEIVRAFVAAWKTRDIDRILSFFAPEALYHNIPMEPVRGVANIRAMLAPFVQGCDKIEWTIHYIAETATGAVLTERVDVFHMGKKTISIPVMGVFELANGKIAKWRDYFDGRDFEKQMAG
jgi:limonene-1,2-epoxide hydrolase